MAEKPTSKIVVVDKPDAAWPISVQGRRAVLWISSRLHDDPAIADAPDGLRDLLARLLLRPWATVFVDAANLPIEELREAHQQVGGLPLRVYSADPPADPPQNRIPIYLLTGAPGPDGVRPSASPVAVLNRLQMLKRAPEGADVFVVGAGTPGDFGAIAEARALSDAFARVIVVGRPASGVLPMVGVDQVTHWPAPLHDFVELLESEAGAAEETERLLVRVQSGDLLPSISLYDCVDQSNPITAVFETVPLNAVLAESHVTADDLRAFLLDPTARWQAYGAGIPFPRHEGYRRDVLRQLDRFKRDGAGATTTVWLQAEDGAGATTTLRHLLFDLARIGWPVLVARPNAGPFNFHQLSSFLTRAAERFERAGVSAVDTPWIIAFDAEHSQVHWDFVTGIAGGLKKLQRPALIIAVKPYSERADDTRRHALGANSYLKPPLRNSVSAEEAQRIGEHLNAFLPVELRRTRSDWIDLVSDTLRRTDEGSRSLFWVALRFWLLRVPGTEESLDRWLRAHVANITNGRPAFHAAILEVAALAKHRLSMPRELVLPNAIGDVRLLATDHANLIGLVALTIARQPSVTLAHTLIAEELLRLASRDENALAAVDKPVCVSPFDLELHLLERIIVRDAVATAAGIGLVEELVTAALRVDPREAPRNYQARDRVVAMLERVPDAVWDNSQVFNHHLAKARRHLAVDPIDATWTQEALREQLELAEAHLLDAIENVMPADDSRRESPLNLHVSLALTYDARAKLEHRFAQELDAAKFRELADRAYRDAQRIDADNSYVLENYARFKLYQQSRIADGDERLRHIVDAIALLEWEWETDETGRREEPILLELANAYDALEVGEGRALLRELAAQGSEAALVALAKLAIRPEGDERVLNDEALASAEELLRRVPPENVTTRSTLALYQVVGRRRPFDFGGRLSLLEALTSDSSFPWPSQLLLELGILLFQLGGAIQRKKGEEVFRQVRDHLADRSGALRVPDELRMLADPAHGYRERLRTSITIRNVGDGGRNYFGIPFGWGSVAIPARVHDFGPNLKPGTERDCFVRFTNFGPQAVPSTFE